MSRNSVKVMMYSYFLILKSYINTYISVTYTEPTVRNVKPKGNHNVLFFPKAIEITVRNVKPKGNHNPSSVHFITKSTVRNVKPKGNHNKVEEELTTVLTVRNVKPKGNHNWQGIFIRN